MLSRSGHSVSLLTLLGLLLCPSLWTAPGNTISIDPNTILVKNVERLGVHFNSHNYYDSVILKRRIAENFEGTIERLHLIGPYQQPDPAGLYIWNDTLEGWKGRPDSFWVGSTAHILSGPDQWQTRKVEAIEKRDYNDNGTVKQLLFVRLDRPVQWPQLKWCTGLLLEKSDLQQGQHPWLIRNSDGSSSLDSRNCSVETNKI
ncbi:MAG: hypothetical protein D6820_13025, partial [Lentisphaerae bacterium]